MLSSEYRHFMDANFATHNDPGKYHVRGVLMFGAAERLRSSMCMDYLADGRIDKFGELMKISHDGDRISRAFNGEYVNEIPRYSDEKMNQLIADLAGEDPQRVLDAQLYMQPGTYACSTEEIDRMVDIVGRVPGVAGAQIAGAGLGGCIMILARKDAVENVQRVLNREYYKPRKLPPAAINCLTVDGAGLAEF
jgi:N-acetylgalactosamine kinase